MPERFFRYVPHARVAAWEAAGWEVISLPLRQAPVEMSNAAISTPSDVVIAHWLGSGEPVEPAAIPEEPGE
jgi:hypothetical protein